MARQLRLGHRMGKRFKGVSMKVGDLIKFGTGYTGLITEYDEWQDAYTVLIHGEVEWSSKQNPTYLSGGLLRKSAEVLSESR